MDFFDGGAAGRGEPLEVGLLAQGRFDVGGRRVGLFGGFLVLDVCRFVRSMVEWDGLCGNGSLMSGVFFRWAEIRMVHEDKSSFIMVR